MLNESDLEPLHWEAKGGTESKKNEVAKQVCGFANSHDGGFLILGADAKLGDAGGWEFGGQAFPDEPAVWISNILQHRLRPLPRTDTNAIRLKNGRWLVVTHITPDPTPPCIANGVVYERIPGATISVRDPERLARLFAMGDLAKSAALENAHHAARDAILMAPGFDPARRIPTDAVIASVGVATTGTLPDIGAKLFSENYGARLRDRARSLAMGFLGELSPARMSQTSVVAGYHGHDDHDPQGVLRAHWNGATAVVTAVPGITSSSVDHLFGEHIHGAIAAAGELAADLGGFGDAYLSVLIRAEPVGVAPSEGFDHLRLDRGPLTLAQLGAPIESLSREAKRASGRTVFEPDADNIG